MDRITPEMVVEACKRLGVKGRSVAWVEMTNEGGYCCCGAGAILAEQYGGAEKFFDWFSIPGDQREGGLMNCFDRFSKKLGLDKDYLIDFTAGFDGYPVGTEPGRLDGVAAAKALKDAGLWDE